MTSKAVGIGWVLWVGVTVQTWRVGECVGCVRASSWGSGLGWQVGFSPGGEGPLGVGRRGQVDLGGGWYADRRLGRLDG